MIEQLPTDQLIERGREALARNEIELALSHLQEAARREPDYADVHHLIGLSLSLQGEAEAALTAFARALELNPRYVEARVSRALTLNELGRYAEARADFEAAAEVDFEEGVGRFPAVHAGRLANKHMELGDLYAEGGAFPDAVEQYRRAAELRPRFVDIRNKLARALLELGEVDAAIGELRSALEVNPSFLEARINLGLAWYRKGDHPAARRAWEGWLELSPEHPQVVSYLRMLQRRGAGS